MNTFILLLAFLLFNPFIFAQNTAPPALPKSKELRLKSKKSKKLKFKQGTDPTKIEEPQKEDIQPAPPVY